MVRVASVSGIAILMVLVSCAPAPTVQSVLPTSVPASDTPVPQYNEAYPTAQAAGPGESQTVSGFAVDLRRAWRDGKQVNAELCFTLPDSSGWTVDQAHYQYGDTVVSEFSSTFLSIQEAQSGQPSKRCDQLSFYVPPDADLSTSSLTVESIAASPPTAEEYCSLYLPKIQQTLADRGTGITVDCPVIDGAMSLQIVGKPEGMSQEEAERLVFSEEFYSIKGPWTFPVTFNQ